MPTPVSTARACLAAEAAAALDEAVAVARRRAHAQTTSLHVVYALLHSAAAGGGASASSAPSSILRDALSRARSSAYSPRLQFKALELCFGMALDRLPYSSAGQRSAAEGGGDEPLVSNSLMAAIKRSQANQRRNPETFHLYQQQQSAAAASGGSGGEASTFSGVKVEIQQLVLAILDDPVVSRVLGDAGFRSTDIKFAVLRPPTPILRFPRAAMYPPLFLCNFSAGDSFDAPLTPGRPVFPFSPDGGDENCRRIGEILSHKGSRRNPMLVGAGAGEAVCDFASAVERQNWAVLPPELRGIELVGIEKVEAIDVRMEELGRKGRLPGLAVNIGDLKEMMEGNAEGSERENCLVSELTRLLEVYQGMLWVMGWSATYETYMKFLSRHPLLDKDWNLQLLPITSVRSGAGGSPRTPRLKGSFVPFTAHESKDFGKSWYQSVSRCNHCNDKYEEEISIILKGQLASVDQQNENLGLSPRKVNFISFKDGFDAAKAKEDNAYLNAIILELQKKWNENCQRCHHIFQTTNTDIPGIPRAFDPSHVSDKERVCGKSSENPEERGFGISLPMSISNGKIAIASQCTSLPLVLQPRNSALSLSHDVNSSKSISNGKIAIASQCTSLPLVLQPRNSALSLSHDVNSSKSEKPRRENFQCQQGDDHTSPCSTTSVATDLVLGTLPESLCEEQNHALKVQRRSPEEPSICLPSVDTVKTNDANSPVVSFAACQDSWVKNICQVSQTHSFSQVSSSCASVHGKTSPAASTTWQQIDFSNYKSFCTSLIDKVGRQEEAAIAVSRAIFKRKTGETRRGASQRADIWLNFHGPDKIAKKRVGVALAELICGSKANITSIDLSCQEGFARPNTICAQQEATQDEVQFRGKLNSDLIAAELSKKQNCVLFVEHVDKADFLLQNCLSHAIRTGRFPDSHGREYSINNAIIILSSGAAKGLTFTRRKDCDSFCEETILAAQCWQMKILSEPSGETNSSNLKTSKASVASIPKSRDSRVYLQSVLPGKRKLDVTDDCSSHDEILMPAKRAHTMTMAFLDLNLPVEEAEVSDDESSSHEEHNKSENSEPWLEEFLELVDERVNFRPFDFDALADSILGDVSKIFCSAFDSDSSLQIDPKVMEEILAVAWSLEDRRALDDWLEQVLGRSFIEMRRKNSLPRQNILRLVACVDTLVEEHAPGLLLPSRIILN